MEIFELKYFLAAANNENIHKGSLDVNVSPASVSKAISRLEAELGVNLFYNEGRNIKLTSQGQALKLRAHSILQLEEDTRYLISGDKEKINIHFGADEILQSFIGVEVTAKMRKLFSKAALHLSIGDDKSNLKKLTDGEIHLALISTDVPKDLKAKTINKVIFKTWAAKNHPIFNGHKKNHVFDIQEVLKHGFVVPSEALLGKITEHGSLDGWREDKFPRIHAYQVQSLKVMENYVRSGRAFAYLPDYYFADEDLVPLQITGCSFNCQQSIKLVCKNPEALGWLSKVWDLF
ncbi:hypothetical protein CIK05_08970 [Bdellovibrio sp. qaytius]|nr:hypothetical protein CIK05_08970 [Bdellovibrio sp. qaytius]